MHPYTVIFEYCVQYITEFLFRVITKNTNLIQTHVFSIEFKCLNLSYLLNVCGFMFLNSDYTLNIAGSSG